MPLIPRVHCAPRNAANSSIELMDCASLNSFAIGDTPSSSIRFSSINERYTSPILRALLPGVAALAAHSSMIFRTRSSLSMRSSSKAPKRARSAGISASRSQTPFTCRKRSSCGRTSERTFVKSSELLVPVVIGIHTNNSLFSKYHSPTATVVITTK